MLELPEIPTMKTKSGFTLIEMIGVLAVIAILATLLVPRVFDAVAEAKNKTPSSTNSPATITVVTNK